MITAGMTSCDSDYVLHDRFEDRSFPICIRPISSVLFNVATSAVVMDENRDLIFYFKRFRGPEVAPLSPGLKVDALFSIDKIRNCQESHHIEYGFRRDKICASEVYLDMVISCAAKDKACLASLSQ